MQTAYNGDWDKRLKPVTTLDYTVPTGNNHIHFDHLRSQECYSPSKAMVMILAAQMFCTSQAQGYPSGTNGSPPWFLIVQGGNLFETLVLNMIGIGQVRGKFDDPPVFWRCTDVVESKRQVPQTSWLYGMFFPARRILLVPQDDGSVQSVYVSQGMNYIDPSNWLDPHVAYRANDKGRFALKPSQERPVWQHFTSMINTKDDFAPQTLANYKRLRSGGMAQVTMYGVATNKASYLQSDRKDLRFPAAIVGNEQAVQSVNSYIEIFSHLSYGLKNALDNKEIPREARRQALQDFSAASENRMFSILQYLTLPDADEDKWLEDAFRQMASDVSRIASQTIAGLTLRGRAMVQIADEQWRAIGSMIRYIEKERGWNNGQ